MAGNWIPRTFLRFVKIKPDELKISILLFFYLFLVIAAYNVVKPIRNASLLEELGYQSLPAVYLLTAVIIGFVVAIHAKLQVRISRYALITSSILFFLISCIVFRLFSGYGWKGLPIVFWVWANVFIIVLNTQFWMTVNDILNPREFKRQSGFFISGGILGGFVGGVLAGLLARENVEYDLLFLSAGLLAVCAIFVYYIFRWQKSEQPSLSNQEQLSEEPTRKPGFRDSLNTVKEHRYLRLIAVIVVLTLIVSTLIDFQWNIIVKESRGEDLTSFFGYFNAGMMVFAFLLSILMTSNLYQRYGVRLTLLLYPIILLLCFMGIGITATLVMAIVIKGSDKSLAYSINRSARELLFIPISPELKYKAIVFIDMFVDRFAKGIGALVLMVILFFGIQDYRNLIRIVSLVSVVTILGWIVLTLGANREYIDSIKQKLPPPRRRADRMVEDELDVDYTKLIFDTLESRGRSADLYAMHIYDLIRQGKLSPEIMKLLSEGQEDALPFSFGSLFEADRTAMLQADSDRIGEDSLKKEIEDIMSLDVYEHVIKAYVEKILSTKGKETETAKMEIAKGIGFLSANSSLVEKLGELLEDDSPEVRRFAFDSVSKLGKREHVPALVQGLNDPSIQSDASTALQKYGTRITGMLADYLSDPDEDIGLRKSVADVLASIGDQESADFIIWQLDAENRELDTVLIDALDRIRSGRPEIQFSKEPIKKIIRREILGYYKDYIKFAEEESRDEDNELCRTLSLELMESLMNIFKLLGLIYPHEDMVKVTQNLQAGTKNSVAYAIELLDNTLEKELKETILPLVEDLSREERATACAVLLKNFPEF